MSDPLAAYYEETTRANLSRRKKFLVLGLSFIGLSIFIAWQGILLKSYVAHDTRPPAWDQADHLDIALDYWQALKSGRWDFKTVFTLPPKNGMPPFPPLYHLALTQAYRFSNPAMAALWVNFAYFALLCFAVFACSYFFRPDYTALLASIAFGASPIVWRLMTTQLMDLPVTALAAVALAAFLFSEGFSRWFGSLLFGFIFGVGMMHKWSFFSYFIPVYVSALGSLKLSMNRSKILFSALLSLVIFAPWYIYHFPILVPRLFQASMDMAVPLWNGGIAAYLFGALDGLGPFLWAAGLAGILTAQYRRHRNFGWVIIAMFVSSYIFWTLIPNRQIRFLLPGLFGLAIATASAWPNAVLGLLAAFQILTVANMSARWISPILIPLPFHSLSLFPTNPSLDQDWHIADILKRAESRSDPALPVNDMTVLANAPRFNVPNFIWTHDALKLQKVYPRPVRERPPEFAEFFLLKTGNLGPPGFIDGLKEARDSVLDNQGWFQAAYEQVARWDLPDKSQAILFQQKRFDRAPLNGRKMEFQFYSAGAFEADHLTLNLNSWDKAASSYPEVDIQAPEIRIFGLSVKNLHLKMKGLSLIPVLDAVGHWRGDVHLLKMNELDIVSAEISSKDLAGFLPTRIPSLTVQRVVLDHDVKINALWRKIPVKAEISMNLSESAEKSEPSLRISLYSLHLGPLSVPHWLLRFWSSVTSLTIPLSPTPETPFKIVPSGLTVANGKISIP